MFFDRFKTMKILAAELVLLISSVLVFRGLWSLMDTIPLMYEPWMLATSFVVGIAASIWALRYLIKK